MRSTAPPRHGTKRKPLGYLHASLAASLMGSLGIFVRHIAASEQLIALARFALGLLFLTAYLGLGRGLTRLVRLRPTLSLVASGPALALCILFYTGSIRSTSLANAAFLLYLGPLLATALAALLNGRWPSLGQLGLLGLAFLGLLLLLELELSLSRAGDYLEGALSAAFYALFIVTNRRIDPGIPPVFRAFHQLLFGTLTLLPVLVTTEVGFSRSDGCWLIAVGLLHGFLAITLMASALECLEAHEYGVISYLEPLVATLLGLLLFSEELSPRQAIGGALILLAGLARVLLSPSPTSPPGSSAA